MRYKPFNIFFEKIHYSEIDNYFSARLTKGTHKRVISLTSRNFFQKAAQTHDYQN